MDIHADIACRSAYQFACMQCHSDPDRLVEMPGMLGKEALYLGGALRGIEGTGEGYKERIAPGFDFLPIPFLNRGAQHPMVLCQQGCILLSQFVEQTCGAFD